MSPCWTLVLHTNKEVMEVKSKGLLIFVFVVILVGTAFVSGFVLSRQGEIEVVEEQIEEMEQGSTIEVAEVLQSFRVSSLTYRYTNVVYCYVDYSIKE